MNRHALLILTTLAACGGGDDGADPVDAAPADAPPPVDAPPPTDAPPGLACLNTAPTSTAPDPMTVEGQVFAVVDYAVAPVDGATVELRRRADDGLIATAATGADGRFTMSAATAGAALDAWFAVSAAGRLPTRAYPGDPLHGGESAFLLLADAAEVAAWYADAGTTYAAGQRTVIASIKDCDNGSPPGVTAAVAPAPAALVYYDDAAQRWDPALPAATNGFALLAGAAATVTLTPSIGGVALPARTIAAAPDTLTLVLATPRLR